MKENNNSMMRCIFSLDEEVGLSNRGLLGKPGDEWRTKSDDSNFIFG